MIIFKHLQIGICTYNCNTLHSKFTIYLLYVHGRTIIHVHSISSLKRRAVLSFTATKFYPEVNGSHLPPFNGGGITHHDLLTPDGLCFGKMKIYRNVPLKGYPNRTLCFSFSSLEDKYMIMKCKYFHY